MKYAIVDNIIDSTHWIPKISDKKLGVTADKKYELFLHIYNEEYLILDDDGVLSMIWIGHPGTFIKMKRSG